MPESLFELVTLKSGTKSLRLVENQETFHPGIGPMAEAKILHVDQQQLRERAAGVAPFVIWDVGLGAAANALSAVEALASLRCPVEIHSFDKTTAPLMFALQHAAALEYPLPHVNALRQLLTDGQVRLAGLHWTLHLGDFRDCLWNMQLPSPHAIFYDPYSLSGNREMWTLTHFANLRRRLDPQTKCLLTNYTRSTVVRVTLLLAGFYVGVGAAVGEKEETTIASNDLAQLANPLSIDWLKRITTSHSSSPLRDDPTPLAPMSADEYRLLTHHPQFARV